MKNTLKSILALAMVICMILTVAGCGDKKNETASDDANDAFFTEAETTDGSTTESTTSTQTQSTTSNQQSQTQSTTSQGTTSQGGNTVTTTVPKENTIGGKSWKDVLAGMPKNLRGTTLVMYNWNPATEYTGAPAVMDSFQKQTGIKVEWRTINYSQYFTKLPALIASGENIPDMARTRGPVPSWVQNYQPLSNSGYDFNDDAWDKNMMELYTFNGKTYCTTLQNTHIGSIDLIFYNKAIIDKQNYEDPYKLWKAGKWTWEKYLSMVEDAKEDGFLGANGERMFTGYLNARGISGAISYNGKQYTSNWLKKDFLKAHQELGDLFNKDNLFSFGGEETFNAGKILFYTGTAVHMRKKNSYFGNLKAANTVYAVPYPTMSGQKTYYQGHGEAEAYGIPKGAKNAAAVPYFLRYFLDGSNYELSTYFGNTQNLEVYNWCMNQKNKVYGYGYPSGVGAIAEGGIQVQTGAQMKSFIDANKGLVDKMVKEYNDQAKQIK